MKSIQAIGSAILVSMIIVLACNEPLQIGTDLISDGEVDFPSTDTISIQAITIQQDSLIAYQSTSSNLTTHYLGHIADPIFGEHSSKVVFQILPESTVRPQGTVDSVVLSIELDTFPLYGNSLSPFTINVSQLATDISPTDIYYTDTDIETGAVIGTALNYTPPSDSLNIVEVNRLSELDTIKVAKQMRIKLSPMFGQLLTGIDSVAYTNVDSFFAVMNGLVISQDGINNAMMPLRLLAINAQGLKLDVTNNKISLYYHDEDGDAQQFDYGIDTRGAIFSTHNHDYGAGPVTGAIDNTAAGEDLLYMQGAGGPSISVKLPYIQDFNDIIVNGAKLIVTTALLPEDDRDIYSLPPQVYLAYPRDTINLLIPDAVAAVQSFRDVTLFGGQPESVTVNGNSEVVYTFNVSEHIQSMITGESSNELIIQLAQNATRVRRAVFKGINDMDNPIKLEITYTEL